MNVTVITGLFSSYQTAVDVVHQLESQGFSSSDISLVSAHPEAHDHSGLNQVSETSLDAVEGKDYGAQAIYGAGFGGVAGLLAGLGMIAIPGIGPVVAAGWLITTLVGAGVGAATTPVVGGLISNVIHHTIAEKEDADFFTKELREGGTIITVRTQTSKVNQASDIMNAHKISDKPLRIRESSWIEKVQTHQSI